MVLHQNVGLLPKGVAVDQSKSVLTGTLDSRDLSSVDPDDWVNMYGQMVKIRKFEEQVNRLYTSAKMPGIAHLYIGQEAVAVGMCEALRNDDYITSTHRGHGHCLAKGGSIDLMFAELLGKEAGYCRGKGGSMHIADQKRGNLGANAIVGGSTGIAAGAALSAKMRGTDQVAVCFFGEGALGQGLLYEAMNIASLWKLPVIYVCESNQYNEFTHCSETTAGDVSVRPEGFGVAFEAVDGQDVRAMHLMAKRVVERTRQGEGPSFILCDCYRFRGHHVGDVSRSFYRSKQEEKDWQKRDPVDLLAAWLLSEGLSDQDTLDQIDQRVQTEIDAGVEFALQAPFPDGSEVDQHVYC